MGRETQAWPGQVPLTPGWSPTHMQDSPPMTPEPSPRTLSTARFLAGLPHTPLPTGASAGSRRRETRA